MQAAYKAPRTMFGGHIALLVALSAMGNALGAAVPRERRAEEKQDETRKENNLLLSFLVKTTFPSTTGGLIVCPVKPQLLLSLLIVSLKQTARTPVKWRPAPPKDAQVQFKLKVCSSRKFHVALFFHQATRGVRNSATRACRTRAALNLNEFSRVIRLVKACAPSKRRPLFSVRPSCESRVGKKGWR